MGRILFFVLIALAVYIGYRWWLAQRQAAARRAMEAMRAGEAMVRCDVCGLNVPQSDALPGPRTGDGSQRWYCSEPHRNQARS